jgi:hypothetical protein
MQTSTIEVLAAVLIVLSVVKLVVISVNGPAWLALAKALYSRPLVTSAVSYVLAGLVLYFLLQSGLTIVQILAVCLFVVLLLVPGFAPCASEVLRWFEGEDLRQILKDQWLYVVVWLVLLGWGIYALLLR